VLGYVQRHGWNATSFQILEPGFRYWLDDAERGAPARGLVAYVDTGRAWVAAGAPVVPADAIAEVSARFIDAARAAGRRAVFFAVEERFLRATSLRSMRVGHQPVWDPTGWERTLRGTKKLREQIRRARAKGVRARRLDAAAIEDRSGPTRVAIEALLNRWVASRPMAPMGFLVELQPFLFPEKRRYFVAEHEGRLLGFLAVVPVYERRGWFCEDLIRDPCAPNGTTELLVHEAMVFLGAEGSHYLTLGLSPLAGSVGPVLRAVRSLVSPLYNFTGLHAFKAKLRPARWDSISLAYPAEQSGSLAMLDTLRAFSREGLLRFGVQTLFRVPPAVLQALAVLLVPWTLALGLADCAMWFPSAWVKWGWVLFDLALAVTLWSLSVRWRPAVATAVSVAATLDAVATLTEALELNIPRAHAAWQEGLVVGAVIAPTIASVLLWRARAVRARWM
jgi:phosphatidylglycerol lysyltransferase